MTPGEGFGTYELRILASIEHPTVVPVLDADRHVVRLGLAVGTPCRMLVGPP